MTSLLDLAQKIEKSDVIKGVLPNGADGLKKLRDIEQAVSGAAGMGAQGMQAMLKQATSALGSIQGVMSQFKSLLSQKSSNVPTVPTGSFGTSHEVATSSAQSAILLLVEELNTMTYVKDICELIETSTAPISAFDDHEEFIRRMDNITDILQTLEALDLSHLGVDQIQMLFTRLNLLLVTFNHLPFNYFTTYTTSDIMNAYPRIITSLNFQGIDKGLINLSATTLINTIRDIEVHGAHRYGQYCKGQLSHAADILVEMLNRVWQLNDTEKCIKQAVDAYYPTLHGMLIDKTLTLDKLTALLQKLIDAISSCSASKVLGSPGGSSSSIPQIGSMIDKTMTDYIKKAITDAGKIQEALKKFTKKQAIVEEKRKALEKTVEGGDKTESPAAPKEEEKPEESKPAGSQPGGESTDSKATQPGADTTPADAGGAVGPKRIIIPTEGLPDGDRVKESW